MSSITDTTNEHTHGCITLGWTSILPASRPWLCLCLFVFQPKGASPLCSLWVLLPPVSLFRVLVRQDNLLSSLWWYQEPSIELPGYLWSSHGKLATSHFATFFIPRDSQAYPQVVGELYGIEEYQFLNSKRIYLTHTSIYRHIYN